MSGRKSLQKGQRGERELATWLEVHLDAEVKRKLGQARESGADIVCVPGLVIEVKRHEVLNLNKWWKQVTDAAREEGGIPVLAFRQNRKRWQFGLPFSLVLEDEDGYIILQEQEFVTWLKKRTR